MTDETRRQAERLGILDRLQAIETELLRFPTITDVDFDVSNYDEIPQVIVLARYEIYARNPKYIRLRHNTLSYILTVCAQHDLWPSGDRTEDQGEHWYIVRNIGDTWPRKEHTT